MEEKIDIKTEGIKYGALISVIAIFIMYGGWIIDVRTYANLQLYSNFIPYAIIILSYGLYTIRKASDGVLTFKQALQFSFLAYVLLAIILAIGTYILHNVIDKDLSQKTLEIGLEKTTALMEKVGASEDDIEKALESARKENATTDTRKILIGTGLGLIWDFVKSMILAALFKKEPQPFK